MYFFDISLLSNFVSIDVLWKIAQWFYKYAQGEPLKSSQGNQIFIWGSNRFIGCPNILIVDNVPTIKVEKLKNRLYLSADFYDKSGKLVMKIIRNKVKVNENNLFKIQEWKKNRLKVVNQFGEPIEITAYKTGEVELNGVFYCGKNRFEANTSGLRINSS